MKSGAFTAAVLALALLTSSPASAASDCASLPPALAGFLKTFLAHYSETGADPSTEVVVREVDLGGPNRQAYVIYVEGAGWCGSGGCNTLVVAKRRRGYKVLAFPPATELPVVLLPTFHGGGRDLAVTLKGRLDGDHFDAPTRAVLSRGGARYRFGKPTAATASIGVGVVLIPADAVATPLYGDH